MGKAMNKWILTAFVTACAWTLPAQTETVKIYDYAARQPWMERDTVITGWDLSLPQWVEPAPNAYLTTGIRTTDSLFPGNRLRKFGLSWRQLEPEEGDYRFAQYADSLDAWQQRGVEGVELHIRGAVWQTDFYTKTDSGKKHLRTNMGTAPRWLEQYGVKKRQEQLMVKVNPMFQVTNLEVYDPAYLTRYQRFVRQFAASELPKHPMVKVIYIHFDSGHTRGEEGNGPNRKSPDWAKYMQTMRIWAKAMGNQVSRCMAMTGWTGDNLKEIVNMGLGQRNGFVEMYLAQVDNPLFGMSVDRRGYILVDETYAPIRDGRAWGDENEEYTREFVPRFGPMSTFLHRYRESSFMTLVMRRNILWEQNQDQTLDPYLTAYMGLELGRNIGNTPDAWCYLRESYIKRRGTGEETPVKNFERWLTQRDDHGTHTIPTRRVDHGTAGKLAGNLYNYYVRGKEYDYTARKADRIGFYLDPRFMEEYSGRIAVKITYYDHGDIMLSYFTTDGSRSVLLHGSGDGVLKTATLFIERLACSPEPEKEFDLVLSGDQEPVEAVFARIIKVDKPQ